MKTAGEEESGHIDVTEMMKNPMTPVIRFWRQIQNFGRMDKLWGELGSEINITWQFEESRLANIAGTAFDESINEQLNSTFVVALY